MATTVNNLAICVFHFPCKNTYTERKMFLKHCEKKSFLLVLRLPRLKLRKVKFIL